MEFAYVRTERPNNYLKCISSRACIVLFQLKDSIEVLDINRHCVCGFFTRFEKNMPLLTMPLKINLNVQNKYCCLMITCHVWVAVVKHMMIEIKKQSLITISN